MLPKLYINIQFVPRSKHSFDCKNQSVNAVDGNNRCLFWNLRKIHKYTAQVQRKIFEF